jgi:hypothetical protein
MMNLDSRVLMLSRKSRRRQNPGFSRAHPQAFQRLRRLAGTTVTRISTFHFSFNTAQILDKISGDPPVWPVSSRKMVLLVQPTRLPKALCDRPSAHRRVRNK